MIDPADFVGNTFGIHDVPMWPAQIYYDGSDFYTDFSNTPEHCVEVEFGTAVLSDDDFIVLRARSVWKSDSRDLFGEWHEYEPDTIE